LILFFLVGAGYSASTRCHSFLFAGPSISVNSPGLRVPPSPAFSVSTAALFSLPPTALSSHPTPYLLHSQTHLHILVPSHVLNPLLNNFPSFLFGKFDAVVRRLRFFQGTDRQSHLTSDPAALRWLFSTKGLIFSALYFPNGVSFLG